MSDTDTQQSKKIAEVLSVFDSHKNFNDFISNSLRDLKNKSQSTTVVSKEVTKVSKNVTISNKVTVVTNNTLNTKEVDAIASLLELVQAPKIHKKYGKKRKRNPNECCYQEINLDDKYMEAIIKQLRIAEINGEINSNSCKRLKILQYLINECQQDGLITCMKSSSENNICILGWSQLLVKEPLQFNIKIREMIEDNYNRIWKNGTKKSLKNLTWIVYELFRKIGVKPSVRGPVDEDPGKDDMLYYKEWTFINDESFKIARQRLATGFSYCPCKRRVI